jgi:hypothetical protein
MKQIIKKLRNIDVDGFCILAVGVPGAGFMLYVLGDMIVKAF